jgi:predicted ribosomally synthesized peptide with SipW-like signal peptide
VKKKIILGLTALVLVVGLTIGGTLAFMQATTATKTNTFTVGNVKLDLNEYATYSDPKNNTPFNQDQPLVPGMPIAKTPILTVKGGSEDSYVRAKIEVPANLAKCVSFDIDSTVWELKGDFYYLKSGAVGKSGADKVLPALFTKVNVNKDVTAEQLEKLTKDELKISVTGYAIQAAGFSNQDDAWAAFK